MAEPFSKPATGWHCQTPRSYATTRQTGPHWVHTEKLLCKLPPHNFIICPSQCQVLNVPAVQTARRLSSQGTKNRRKDRQFSSFYRQKNSVIYHTELGNQPLGPKLEKDVSGSCCRHHSVSLPLEHVTLTTSGTAPQGCEAGCPFGQDRLSWRQNPFLKELCSGGERDHLLTWACLAASLQD